MTCMYLLIHSGKFDPSDELINLVNKIRHRLETGIYTIVLDIMENFSVASAEEKAKVFRATFKKQILDPTPALFTSPAPTMRRLGSASALFVEEPWSWVRMMGYEDDYSNF